MFWIIFALNWLFLSLANCQTCLTTSDSPNSNVKCALPFIFKDKLRTSCITETDPDGRFWCSTRTDSQGNHVGGQGFWGYCRSECQNPPTTTTTTTTTTRTTKIPRVTQQQVRPSSGTGTASGTYLPTEEEQTCGLYLGTHHIVGGSVTKRGELPFVVALGYRGRSGVITYNCGATLINRRYVITAAHCHHKTTKRLQIAEVVIGDHDISKDPDCNKRTCRLVQRFNIRPRDITVHEGWEPNTVTTNGDDIALVRLPRPAITVNEEFDEIVLPICLGWRSNIKVPNDKFLVAGWGRTNNDPSDSGDIRVSGAFSSLMLKLEVPVIPINKCKTDFKIFKGINSVKHICAGGERGKDSCSGDSGGPLMSQVTGDFKKPKYLYGIVSFGTRRCGTGIPGVYTNVAFYMDWIISHLRP